MIRLRSGRSEVALHTLSEREGPKLLALHELQGCAQDFVGIAEAWPGSVYALDFSGHGASDWLAGRAYSAERWAEDADAALGHLQGAYLIGRGVGATAALLLAGARPDKVPAIYLAPGAGLHACGEHPDATRVAEDRAFLKKCLEVASMQDESGPDPFVIETESHHRTRRYALGFAERAGTVLLGEDGSDRPAWWDAIRACANVEAAPVDEVAALALLGLR